MINLDHALFGNCQKEPTSMEYKNGSYKIFKKQIQDIYKINASELLCFSQNASTCLALFLEQLGDRKIPVYMSSHEIVYFKDLLETGIMPEKKVTRPNFAKLESIKIKKRKVQIFEPEEIFELPKGEKIILISHVSRISGEILFNENSYLGIKKNDPGSILILDVAQSVGALSLDAKKIGDLVLGVNSKFIGAQAHIAFCYINKKVQEKYKIERWDIKSEIFQKEILSSVKALETLTSSEKKISDMRKILEKELDHAGIDYFKNEKSSPQILIIKEDGQKKREFFIKELEQEGVKVSSNTEWTIKEVSDQGLRISISARNNHKEIERFVKIFKIIKNRIKKKQ